MRRIVQNARCGQILDIEGEAEFTCSLSKGHGKFGVSHAAFRFHDLDEFPVEMEEVIAQEHLFATPLSLAQYLTIIRTAIPNEKVVNL